MINQWLKHKDYNEGLDILRQYPDKQIIANWIAKSETKATKKLLEETLLEILSKAPKEPEKRLFEQKKQSESEKKRIEKRVESPKQKTEPKDFVRRPDGTFSEDSEDAPSDVKELVEKRKALYNTRTSYKAMLNQTVRFHDRFTNEERLRIIAQFNKVRIELKRIWQDIVYYRKKGELPVTVIIEKPDLTKEEVWKRIMTVRTYISKAQNGILKTGKLEAYQAELKQLHDTYEYIKQNS